MIDQETHAKLQRAMWETGLLPKDCVVLLNVSERFPQTQRDLDDITNSIRWSFVMEARGNGYGTRIHEMG